jgi:hypothetical protein
VDGCEALLIAVRTAGSLRERGIGTPILWRGREVGVGRVKEPH